MSKHIYRGGAGRSKDVRHHAEREQMRRRAERQQSRPNRAKPRK